MHGCHLLGGWGEGEAHGLSYKEGFVRLGDKAQRWGGGRGSKLWGYHAPVCVCNNGTRAQPMDSFQKLIFAKEVALTPQQKCELKELKVCSITNKLNIVEQTFRNIYQCYYISAS